MTTWQPTTSFYKILDLKKRLKAVYGGASSGKTYNILAKFYQDAVDNPGEVITVASNTLANLKRSAMRDFKNILVGRKAWDPSCWKISEQAYTFNNGSIIEFMGLDDETKARGPRRQRLFIDEANRVSFDVYQQLERRTEKEILLSWNPSAPFWYNEHIQGILDHDELVVNFMDNEALNDAQLEYFDTLRTNSTRSDYAMNEWKVYGLGEWGQTRGACITDYKFCRKDADGYFYDEKTGDALDGFQAVGVGLDFGDNDPNAAVLLHKHKERQSYIAEEIMYKPGLLPVDIYNELKDYDLDVYADYSNGTVLRDLDNRGLSIHKCRKGNDSIKYGTNLINELDLYIVRGSDNLQKEFELYRYKEDKDGNLVDGKYEGPDHLVDALRYVLREHVRPDFWVV